MKAVFVLLASVNYVCYNPFRGGYILGIFSTKQRAINAKNKIKIYCDNLWIEEIKINDKTTCIDI